jgi:hypothetical protein
MATGGLSRETAIVVKAPEEVKATTMMAAAWRVGLGLILKKCKECAGEGRLFKRRKTGTMQPAKVTATASPWFGGVDKNLAVRKQALAQAMLQDYGQTRQTFFS